MGGIQFDQDVRSALAAAFDCAAELGHTYVGTEHLLLGLLRTETGLFAGATSGAELESRVYAEVGRPRRRPGARPRSTLPYTSLAKRVLQHALDDAKRGDAAAVGAPHLLAGLMADDRGIAGRVLRRSGFLGPGARRDPEDGAPWNAAIGVIRVDDKSALPYYEQIIARIKEAVAAGDLSPGDRLPPVRRLADSLELAPGTVARAYSLLEQDVVIETDGPRGTTVAFPRGPTPQKAGDRVEELAGLLRPAVVAAFHLGGTAEELFEALGTAVAGVFDDPLPH
ncbi:MAG: GntR family transcriptional regulator [Gemmatimonadota bacterium]|nr:MAG: GntR family transcriptional regulator [Gemmatimonadota bacterium]